MRNIPLAFYLKRYFSRSQANKSCWLTHDVLALLACSICLSAITIFRNRRRRSHGLQRVAPPGQGGSPFRRSNKCVMS